MPLFDFEAYEERLNDDSWDGYDPLNDDAFEDNLLSLYEHGMSEKQHAEYMASMNMAEVANGGGSLSIESRLELARQVTGWELPSLSDVFDRLTEGGFMEPLDFYRIIWDH